MSFILYVAQTLGGQEDEGVRCMALSLPALCQFTKLTTATEWSMGAPRILWLSCISL